MSITLKNIVPEQHWAKRWAQIPFSGISKLCTKLTRSRRHRFFSKEIFCGMCCVPTPYLPVSWCIDLLREASQNSVVKSAWVWYRQFFLHYLVLCPSPSPMMNIPLVPQTTRELNISGIALLLVDSQYGRNWTSWIGASHAATKKWVLFHLESYTA